jgi:hypothetical protein
LFSIDWLRGAVPVEREICVFPTKEGAIAAAKARALDVAKRYPGRELDSLLTDADGKSFPIAPIRDWKRWQSRTSVIAPYSRHLRSLQSFPKPLVRGT